MSSYILRRLLVSVLLVWGVVTLVFALLELAPGDASDAFMLDATDASVRENLVVQWRLDDPAHTRYLRMLRNLATGDLGWSYSKRRPVAGIIGEALPNTLVLSGVALVVIYVTGVFVGTIQALRRHSWVDHSLSVVTLFMYSVPAFWLALMLILLFSLKLDLLPAAGMVDPVEYDLMGFDEPVCLGRLCVDLISPSQLWDRSLHLLLPGVALAMARSAGAARFMRAGLIEALNEDHVRTARAKGLSERKVILRHALRNALLPIITLVGLSLPFLLGGSVVVETVFAWPGMGRAVVGAILSQDTPVVVATVYLFSIVVVAGNLLADLACAALDPRVRLS